MNDYTSRGILYVWCDECQQCCSRWPRPMCMWCYDDEASKQSTNMHVVLIWSFAMNVVSGWWLIRIRSTQFELCYVSRDKRYQTTYPLIFQLEFVASIFLFPIEYPVIVLVISCQLQHAANYVHLWPRNAISVQFNWLKRAHAWSTRESS